jgi:pyruvate kinase
MRKTKIICTLGPATEKTDMLRQLIEKGSDVFRLNMSHATHDWVRNLSRASERSHKKRADQLRFCLIRKARPSGLAT